MNEMINHCCGICLKQERSMHHVSENDTNNIQIIFKLKCAVPDIDWTSDFSICSGCCGQLNLAYIFRELCVHSQKFRQQSMGYVAKEQSHLEDDVCNESCTDGDFGGSSPTGAPEPPSGFQCSQVIETNDVDNDVDISAKQSTDATESKDRRSKQFECPGCMKKYTTKYGVKKHTKICKKMERNIGNEDDEAAAPDAGGPPAPPAPDQDAGETGTRAENECGRCGASFGNKYLVRRHVRNVHATEKLFGCAQCPRRFASAVYLAAHERYHRRDRSHICATCGKGYITASDLYHHEKIHANRRAYRCDACDKGFNTSSDLHKHRICVHLDRSLWKYVCAYCQKRFPLKTNLDTHTKTHTGERRFACHLCDRRCINRSVLLRHIDTHSNVQSFKCHVCLHTYKYKKSLDLHMAKVHGVGDVPTKVKRYFCHVCPKSYFVNSKLQKHLRTHTGDKPFKCPTCQKGFVEKSYVKQHLKTAHGVTDWPQS